MNISESVLIPISALNSNIEVARQTQKANSTGDSERGALCPVCGYGMVATGKCRTCPNCGHNSGCA